MSNLEAAEKVTDLIPTSLYIIQLVLSLLWGRGCCLFFWDRVSLWCTVTHYIDQAEICLPLPPTVRTKGLDPHAQPSIISLTVKFLFKQLAIEFYYLSFLLYLSLYLCMHRQICVGTFVWWHACENQKCFVGASSFLPCGSCGLNLDP